MRINDPVNTPVGPGKYLGAVEVLDKGIVVETVHVVEVVVTDTVRPHMENENCITPKSKVYAKFLFDASELTL